MTRISLAQARIAWAAAQGLGAEARISSVPGGWIRAIGGVDPYLALQARVPSARRADMDASLAAGQIHIVPGVRGCIWLVPRDDVALALKVSSAQARRRQDREMEKLGVTRDEQQQIADAVRAALEGGPLSTDALRAALPDGMPRSLGAAGKKLGHTTPLPATLRSLEWDGLVRRQPEGGRLDTNRYVWTLSMGASPLTWGDAPDDPAGQAQALAERFWAWAGVASLDEFVGWAKVGKRVAKAAAGALGLLPIEIDGLGEALVRPQDDHLLTAPADDGVHLLTAQDNLLALRGAPGVLADPAHHGRKVLGIGGRKGITLANATWMNQRPLIHRGEWIGFWEWDPDAREIVVAGFAPPTEDVIAACRATCDRLRPLIADDLDGRARANAIDGPKNQRARVDAVRALLAETTS